MSTDVATPPAVTGTGGLAVTVRGAADLTEAELTEWRELEAAAVSANPFLVPEWVQSWYAAYVPDEADRLVLLVRSAKDGRLVGLAPVYRQQLSVGPLRVARRLVPVGAGVVTPYELPGYLAVAGQHRDVSRALVQATTSQDVDWSLLCIAPDQGWFEPEHVMEGSTTGGEVDFWQQLPSRACVILPLQPTWEATQAGFKRNLKESLRRSRNRLRKSGLSYAVHRRTGAELDATVVNRLLDLHRDRSANDQAGQAHADYYADPASRDLLLGALPALAERERASVFELELDGQVVAAQLALHGPGSTYLHSSGFRPEVWSFGAITHLVGAVVQDAAERGDSLVNFSPGPRVSKLRWSEECWVWHEFAYGVGSRAMLARYLLLRGAAAVRPAIAGVAWNRRNVPAIES